MAENSTEHRLKPVPRGLIRRYAIGRVILVRSESWCVLNAEAQRTQRKNAEKIKNRAGRRGVGRQFFSE